MYVECPYCDNFFEGNSQVEEGFLNVYCPDCKSGFVIRVFFDEEGKLEPHQFAHCCDSCSSIELDTMHNTDSVVCRDCGKVEHHA